MREVDTPDTEKETVISVLAVRPCCAVCRKQCKKDPDHCCEEFEFDRRLSPLPPGYACDESEARFWDRFFNTLATMQMTEIMRLLTQMADILEGKGIRLVTFYRNPDSPDASQPGPSSTSGVSISRPKTLMTREDARKLEGIVDLSEVEFLPRCAAHELLVNSRVKGIVPGKAERMLDLVLESLLRTPGTK